jgi:sterol desaturase/sphingolipid hydroxylase (fatty acid hydroxylase superfamily)
MTTVDVRATMTPARRALRVGYVPSVWAAGVLGCALAARGGGRLAWLPALLAFMILISLAVERLIPYERDWNADHSDRRRDLAHALVNETLLLLSAAAVPAMTAFLGDHRPWPRHWPFALQVLIALLSLDLGITLLHMVSHRIGWLWRFHAVHHSVERLYSFNGLMKHPVHQALETAAGSLPLVLLGVPRNVAAAAAFCVALALLLQHSNADYAVGRLGRVFVFNAGHRFHHLRRPGEGDVNFGLFTLVWDRLLGTFSFDPDRRFTTADIGIAAWPNYPRRYWAQLRQPFAGTAGLAADGR